MPDSRARATEGFVLGALGVLGFSFTLPATRIAVSQLDGTVVGLGRAVVAVVRAGERPTTGFWISAAFGLGSVLAFAAAEGAGTIQGADVLVLMAVFLGALGYAEGGALAREIGGWRVICWALVASLPVTVPAAAVAALRAGISAGPGAWLGFAYVSAVSMFLAFFPWYRGLAIGGVARIAQVQLAQPVLTLLWSAILIGERVGPTTVAAAFLVLASVAATQRTAVRRTFPSAAAGVIQGEPS